MMRIFEAFTPSGTEAPDWSGGLFTGDHQDIREWVALNSPYWRPDQVRLVERPLLHVTPELIAKMRAAKADLEKTKAALDALLRGRT